MSAKKESVETTDEEKTAVTTEITESAGGDITPGAAEPADIADVADIAEADVDDDADALVLTGESESDSADEKDADEADADADASPAPAAKAGLDWTRVFAFAVLPALALLLAGAAAFLKWQDAKVRDSEVARAESVQVAKDSTIRLLSYKPDTVEQELTSARDLLTGNFRDSYTQLTNDVVIPGAKEKKIAALANVPAVASISATPSEAVALVFVNQTVTVGNDAPTSTNSSVKVTLDKVGDRWLISEFDPV